LTATIAVNVTRVRVDGAHATLPPRPTSRRPERALPSMPPLKFAPGNANAP
jgi:hypothetical protein